MSIQRRSHSIKEKRRNESLVGQNRNWQTKLLKDELRYLKDLKGKDKGKVTKSTTSKQSRRPGRYYPGGSQAAGATTITLQKKQPARWGINLEINLDPLGGAKRHQSRGDSRMARQISGSELSTWPIEKIPFFLTKEELTFEQKNETNDHRSSE